MQYDDKNVHCTLVRATGRTMALKTSHTAEERQVEYVLWKAIYQNLPVLLILPFLVHF